MDACGLGSLVGGPPLLLATLRLISGSFLRQNFKTVYIFKTRVLQDQGDDSVKYLLCKYEGLSSYLQNMVVSTCSLC